MKLSEEELIRELRGERPQVDGEFGRELDEWAAAGFPRGGPAGPGRVGVRGRVAQGFEGLREKLRATPPRRLIAPVGAAAVLVVIAGVAVTQNGSEPVPTVAPGPAEDLSLQSPSGDGGVAVPEGEAGSSAESLEEPASAGKAGGNVARQRAQGRAEIAQDVRLVLTADGDEVQDVANGVNEVTNRYRGYVVNSDVRSGDDAIAPGADFRLRIPADKLQRALADLSELADVQSRDEGTKDITGRVISAEERIERLEDALASTEQKLAAAHGIERKEFEDRIDVLESELETQQRRLAQARDRVDLVPVDVSIVTDSGNSDWGIDDALDDAGDVLVTIGGGLLVAGAVLVPLALLGAIAYAVNRRRVRRARDRALD